MGTEVMGLDSACPKFSRNMGSLSAIDGQLLDGLDFCRTVYDLFDEVKRGPDGTRRLRLRQSQADKRLVEELLPLAVYIQTRYRAGTRISVRWESGSQPYDAILCFNGSSVVHDGAPRKLYAEVTTSVHPRDYLVRERVHLKGGSFGPRGTYRGGKDIVSNPCVYNGFEILRDFAAQILRRLDDKARKSYPAETVLVISCIPPHGLVLENEWETVIKELRIANPNIPFREVFLVDRSMSYTATLYGNREQPPQVHV